MYEREPAERVLRLLVRVVLVPRERDDLGSAGRQRDPAGSHLRLELHISDEERRRLLKGTQRHRQDHSTVRLPHKRRKRTGEQLNACFLDMCLPVIIK